LTTSYCSSSSSRIIALSLAEEQHPPIASLQSGPTTSRILNVGRMLALGAALVLRRFDKFAGRLSLSLLQGVNISQHGLRGSRNDHTATSRAAETRLGCFLATRLFWHRSCVSHARCTRNLPCVFSVARLLQIVASRSPGLQFTTFCGPHYPTKTPVIQHWNLILFVEHTKYRPNVNRWNG
jgi:hypothetical protein